MDQENRQGRSLIIWIMLAGGLVVVVTLGLLIGFLITKGTSPSTSAVPYDLTFRPFPIVTNVRDLFPQTLGAFNRKTVSGNLAGTAAVRFSATYTRGNDTININGARDSNNAQAQADVTTQITQAGLDRPTVVGNSLAYSILTNRDGSVRLLYAHTFWYFDLTANSRSALDDFMKVFRY